MIERWAQRDTIGLRVAIATVVVALGALAVATGLTMATVGGDVSAVARRQHDQVVAAEVTAITNAYKVAGSWRTADLAGEVDLAQRNQARLTVLDSTGRQVPLPPGDPSGMPSRLTGALRSVRIRVHRDVVGTAIVHFYDAALPSAESQLRDAFLRTLLISAATAAGLALAVSRYLSRWTSRPVRALQAAVRQRAAGHRQARAGDEGGRGELARAFDTMADTVDRQDELRQALMADVAHELRTPLAVLQARTESLLDGLSLPGLQQLALLHEEVLHLGRTVDDLETLAHAEAAAFTFERRPTDLAEVAARAVDALEYQGRDAGVALVTDLSPTWLVGDPHRLDQVVVNLVSNAIKFSSAGDTVSVSVRPEGDRARLEVADTGLGIPPDELPFVFDRFWRGRHSGRLAGSGVGLAVVQTVVTALGGRVSVTSTPGSGACFSVVLPVGDYVARPPVKAR